MTERVANLEAVAAGASPLSEQGAAEFQEAAGRIAAAVNGFIQGKAEVVDLALVCLLAEGHLLLEDVPGVGKTSLARSLAGALGTPWQRIQFTPDLLPGDVTGVSVFHQDASEFVFHPGPVFANVVLADEINRASPRTQSALLEVMEERQVTVDGRPYRVPRPFLVMATQNPIEMDGTYPLPEAQLDRFLVKTRVGYPDHAGGGAGARRRAFRRRRRRRAAGERARRDRAPRPRRPKHPRGAGGLRLHGPARQPHAADAATTARRKPARRPGTAAHESRLRGAPRTSLRRARRRPDSRRAGARPPDPDVAVVRSVGWDRGRGGRGGDRVRARAADRPAPVTLRAAGLLVGGAGLAVWGWFAGWPELTALGAAAVTLVVLVLLVAGPAPRVRVALDQAALRVVRGQEATVRMKLHLPRRRRWLRIVEGSPSAPVATSPLTGSGAGDDLTLRLPVDTSLRGERPIGPYAVVHGDPWSIVRRVTARSEGGVLTVHPRTVRVRRSALPALQQEESEFASRRSGDEHFFALRDYVLGDEPRTVHWRSSARAGKLVVKQQVSGAPNHTVIVLDTDASAYSSDDQFGSSWVAERFEAAVEVAASFAVAHADRAAQLYVVTTSRGASVTTAAAGATDVFLDAFAAASAVPPVDTAPEEIAPLVRRTHCRLLMLITGTPGPRVVGAMRTVAPITSSLTIVRVASGRQEPLQGLRVLDVVGAEDLVAAQ